MKTIMDFTGHYPSINPFIWQERVPYEFQQLTDEDKSISFMTDEFLRHSWSRKYGVWILANGFCQQAELNHGKL